MKKLAGVLAAVLAVLIIGALYLWVQLGTARQQLVAQQNQVAELEGARNVAATAGATVAASGSATSTTAASSAAAGAAVGNPAAAAPSADRIAAGMKELLGSDVLAAQLRQQFPDAAQELGLSPAEADRFYNLLAKQAADTVGDALGMVGGGAGDGAAAQEAARKMVEKQLAGDREMANLLGGRYSQWEDYQGTIAARQQVNQLKVMLASGDNALTDAKSKPLIAALGAETARINSELKKKMAADLRTSKNLMEEQLQYTSEQNGRLINAATPHLSSAQLDRYKQLLKQQEVMVRALMGGNNKQGASR